MTERLTRVADDLSAALRLGRDALFANPEAGSDPAAHLPQLEAVLRSGSDSGRLWRTDAGAVGLALWEPLGPIGLAVQLLYLAPTIASVESYRRFLLALDREVAPVAFLPSRLPGLTPEVQSALLGNLEFRPYSRSDMVLPAERSIPVEEPSRGLEVRPYRPEDVEAVARVHAAAFEHHFDRYLFLEDLDPVQDARAMLRGLGSGRWGPFRPAASMVAEERGKIIGSTLVVGTPQGALIADVAVDPAHGGRGVGRSLMVATIRALRAGSADPIRLVVTEGNPRAVRLYERLGFVRRATFQEWYRSTRVPVDPESG